MEQIKKPWQAATSSSSRARLRGGGILMILWLNKSKNLSKKMINMYVFCAFQIYKIKTTPLAPCQDGRKFGWEVEHVKAWATAAQGPYATYATSYLGYPAYLNMLHIITHNYELVTLLVRDCKKPIRPHNYVYFTRPIVNCKDALRFVKSLQTLKYDES